MKYLRRFNENLDNDYYRLVSIYPILHDLVSELDTPSNDVYLKLKKYYSNNKDIKIKNNQSLNNGYGLSDIWCVGIDFRNADGVYFYNKYYKEFAIYSMKDEFFIVSVVEWSPAYTSEKVFYKCDQFDGLIRFIDDRIKAKNEVY